MEKISIVLNIAQQYDFNPLEGEKVDEVKGRLAAVVAEIKAIHGDESVLIVTHGGIVRALYHMYHGIEIKGAENASVHEFEI